ncbi:MscS family inner membrane protein YnaI [Oceanobacillus picturae]|uniref:MscS family inner membrane protein YnaI n=1 Tax=Oceanobacillus picturae TaxID=171693 RepID=W9BBZ3_9BACI|nr:mechanosensitive ion channel family protein [Oceanobacillus picturae]RIU91973.1 mechanosensitive ion channel family protein [Oceanobacillus picturae]CDO03910.1 MscS family inner membrane protein YnaI [Oceanobacillus picturae]
MFWELVQQYENQLNIALSIVILAVFLLLRIRFTATIFRMLLKVSRNTWNGFFEQLRTSFEKPLQLLIAVVGIYFAVDVFPYFNESNALFNHLVRSSVIFAVGWGLYNLSSSSSLLFSKINHKYNVKIDHILIPFFSKALRLIIVAIGISVIAQEFEYDINGFVAGLGIGGLAFALAAKDALANLFGGIIIITEKPFTIGDWIKTPSVEGTIEDISFRSTKVRTFAQALVTVPNATLSNEAITNWSKMGKRQITFKLSLMYGAKRDQLEGIVKEIQVLLRHHDAINKETILVNVDAYGENGWEIFLYFFTNTTDWEEHLKVKQEINLAILAIIEREKLEIAIPTRKLYVEPEMVKEKQRETLLGQES